ncbi:MAG: aminotransferase class I/II-fold pyridoxal phosphate-dependent enzyme [Anaerolineales bacterium]|jgi:methionine-gamma-lyase
MKPFSAHHGLSTLVNHFGEDEHPLNAHLAPIFQTATFSFPDVNTGIAIETGEQPGYIYTRVSNPNARQLASKIALLEGLDLLRERPGSAPEEVVDGIAFGSGMAAINAAILGRVQSSDTIVAQHALYGDTFNLLNDMATRLGIKLAWVMEPSPTGWRAALRANPHPALVYVETPVNPTLQVIDLAEVAELAHQQGSWLVVDNTFASPYCQRPLSLGADVVVHSTTKYLSGHGAVIGGVVVSPHLDYLRGDVQHVLERMGGAPSPFDCWLANLGLRTFELRMQRHCENAAQIAHYLAGHPKVARVNYPGLEEGAGYAIARKQMHAFGGILSFELKGGLEAGKALMDSVQVITLAVSLGNVDTLIQHPASMTQSRMPRQERLRMGVSDGLVRLSAGIENTSDLIDDLEQALAKVPAG